VTKAPSLAYRMMSLLAVAQLAAFLTTWLAGIATYVANYGGYEDFQAMLNDLAPSRTTDLVAASLIKGEDGSIRIEPTAELRSEMRRVPNLRFAALDPMTWTPVAGSFQEMTVALSASLQSRPCHLHFRSSAVSTGGYDGHLACRTTPFGQVPIVLSGFKFKWSDTLDLIYSSIVNINWQVSLGFSAATVMATVSVWIAIRRGLRPLIDVDKNIKRIDINSLNQRLSTVGVPAEIRSLVDSVNDALKRLDAAVGRERRFAANAAHELRTPLAIMRGRLENANASSLRNELIGDTDQLRSIVEQMLISVRLAEGQIALDQHVDLDKTLRRLVSDLVPVIADRDRFLEFEGSATPLVVCGNQRAIESVATNLIENAVRAEPKDGTVCIRIDDDGVIAVIDHGKGVPPEDREMIFERFWRRSDASSGAGLGLAIAKDIVDAHRGRIWVEETPGGGATFKIALTPLRE